MQKLLITLFVVLAAACQPQAPKQGLTIADYQNALRDAGMHDVRFERNVQLPKDIIATVGAADVYVAGQHELIVQRAPGKKGDEVKGFFNGYIVQKWNFYTNDNLILVTEPNVQKELVEVFQQLR